MDFGVELFDPNDDGYPRLHGDDTHCTIKILDEDSPGTLGFGETDIRVSKRESKVEIIVTRSEGADGEVKCSIKTEKLSEKNLASNAKEYEDYVPKHEQIIFAHGE